MASRLFCFGFGYSARALAKRCLARGWSVAGTARSAGKADAMRALGAEPFVFADGRPLDDFADALDGATHLLISAPPDRAGDPVLNAHGKDVGGLKNLAWVGYLSTTGVYGDTGGATVDENSPLVPTSVRSRQRADAETAWLRLHRDSGVPVHIFRLAGIYGPGRSALDQVRNGSARRIDRPGHLFSRIHVDDIANVLRASIARPDPGAVYNVCDDEPAAPADVTAEACRLLGVAPPPLVPFDEAAKDMSEMAKSFWRDNRRVANGRIKRDLGVRLRYPDYRAGLKAVLDAGG